MRFFACFALVLSLLAAPALANEALVKSEVSVDVTGKDAADAKAMAMAKGQVDALTELLAKLTPPGQAQDIISTLDGKKIAALVKGTEILDEKITSVRYRAKLSVSFDASDISELIAKFNAGVESNDVIITTGSFVVIPSFEEAGNSLLWDEENPWLKSWRTIGLEVTTGDIIVPYGDSRDSATVGTKNISTITYSAMAPLLQRYGASDVVVAQAKYTPAPDMSITVTRRRINRTLNEVSTQTYRADPQETRDELMQRVARDIVYTLQNKKSKELSTAQNVRGGERNKVMALASITTMASWTQLRQKLTSLPMVDRLEMIALSPTQVDMVIHYRGSPESLARAIGAKKLRLVENPNYWVLSYD